MSGGHTQGPWMLGARYPESHWIDVVSQTDERGLPFVSCKHHDEEANARRIVAAVNGTAGISTAALEAGVVAKLVEAGERSHTAMHNLIVLLTDSDPSETELAIVKLLGLASNELECALALARGEQS